MQRPVSVTVFAILNIVFAGIGLVALLFSSVVLFSVADPKINPVGKIIQENPSYGLWIKCSIPLGVLGILALLAAGIGMLQLKEWARKLSLGYSVYTIITGLIGIGVNYVFLVQPLMKEAAQKQGPEAAGAMGAAFGGVFGGCIGMIYPVLLIAFMTRPPVKAAFRTTDDQYRPPDEY